MRPTLNFPTLVLFLIITQAVPPVPRKVAGDTSNLSNDRNNHGDANKTITNPAPIQNTVGPKSTENSNEPATTQQKNQHIIVDRLPDKDLWDKIYICSTIGLVLVGALTFGVIWYQAAKTRDAAEATLLYAKAFIESQRAQLAVSFDSPISAINAGNPPKIRMKFINKGVTPAYDCIFETWIEILPEPFTDFTPSAVYNRLPAPMTIYANAPSQSVVDLYLKRTLTEKEFQGIKLGNQLLCFRTLVKYSDAFGKPRWQEFGFAVRSVGMEYLPKYNGSGNC